MNSIGRPAFTKASRIWTEFWRWTLSSDEPCTSSSGAFSSDAFFSGALSVYASSHASIVERPDDEAARGHHLVPETAGATPLVHHDLAVRAAVHVEQHRVLLARAEIGRQCDGGRQRRAVGGGHAAKLHAPAPVAGQLGRHPLVDR